MPRSVGRVEKLAASTRTQSSESGGGTFERTVCFSCSPDRLNSITVEVAMVAAACGAEALKDGTTATSERGLLNTLASRSSSLSIAANRR